MITVECRGGGPLDGKELAYAEVPYAGMELFASPDLTMAHEKPPAREVPLHIYRWDSNTLAYWYVGVQ